MNALTLGLDTGGTHTDAVIYNPQTRTVAAYAKAETTHHDLSVGIARALEKLAARDWPGGREAVTQISLSTTLATNAIAEGVSSRVGLIMMGYDADQEAVRQLVQKLPLVESVFVRGSHDYYGTEEEPLDEEAIEAAVGTLDPHVSAWAVSGFFSVKNPAHELAASRIIRSLSQKPITLGRDLTGEYDAVRRAATAALNAGLVGVINRLLEAVKKAARGCGFKARLMVVKGDGSLVSEDWARDRPIETVVSGPAASLVGAKTLGRGLLTPGEKDLWVLDIGGTTTDLALVRDGRPAVNPNGARVGAWNTMTVAVETRTRGLGGDSLVTMSKAGDLTLGPRRVLPLCRLADEWPQVVRTLKYQRGSGLGATLAGCFFLPGSPPDSGLNDDEIVLLRALERETPLALATHAETCFQRGQRFSGVNALKHPAILVSAFTPTDAMAVLGLYGQGSREAACIGAEILGRSLRLTAEEVAFRVLEEFGRLLAEEIICHGFDQDGVHYQPEEFSETGVFSGPLGRGKKGKIRVELGVEDSILLLGAPAAVLAPFLGRRLKGTIIVPPVYDAASAVGAAAAPIYLRRKVEIHSLPNFAGFRLFLPSEMIDGDSVDELSAIAEEKMAGYMRTLALTAGAGEAKVSVHREDRRVRTEEGDVMELGASLSFAVTEARPASSRAGGYRPGG